MDYLLVLLFAVGFLCAAMANALFFWMRARLIEKGVSVKQFLFVTDIYRALKDYHQTARLKGWSSFPVALFVLSTSLTFLFLLAFVIRLQEVGGK